MANTNTTNRKPTKREYFASIRAILLDNECDHELIDFIDREVSALEKKSAKNSSANDNAKSANAEIVYNALAEIGRAVSPSELLHLSPNLAENEIKSTQKLTPLLAYLVENGRVSKSAFKSGFVYAVIA